MHAAEVVMLMAIAVALSLALPAFFGGTGSTDRTEPIEL